MHEPHSIIRLLQVLTHFKEIDFSRGMLSRPQIVKVISLAAKHASIKAEVGWGSLSP